MCREIGLEWTCGCSWRSWVLCERAVANPNEAGEECPDPDEGGYMDVLPLTWDCSPECCMKDINAALTSCEQKERARDQQQNQEQKKVLNVIYARSRTTYARRINKHMNNCQPQIAKYLFRTRAMANEMRGQPPTNALYSFERRHTPANRLNPLETVSALDFNARVQDLTQKFRDVESPRHSTETPKAKYRAVKKAYMQRRSLTHRYRSGEDLGEANDPAPQPAQPAGPAPPPFGGLGGNPGGAPQGGYGGYGGGLQQGAPQGGYGGYGGGLQQGAQLGGYGGYGGGLQQGAQLGGYGGGGGGGHQRTPQPGGYGQGGGNQAGASLAVMNMVGQGRGYEGLEDLLAYDQAGGPEAYAQQQRGNVQGPPRAQPIAPGYDQPFQGIAPQARQPFAPPARSTPSPMQGIVSPAAAPYQLDPPVVRSASASRNSSRSARSTPARLAENATDSDYRRAYEYYKTFIRDLQERANLLLDLSMSNEPLPAPRNRIVVQTMEEEDIKGYLQQTNPYFLDFNQKEFARLVELAVGVHATLRQRRLQDNAAATRRGIT